jgi:GNAT superfamily N-acetyltransferase
LIRPFSGPADREVWLEIVNQAFAASGRIRPWGPAEFQRELESRDWWHPNRLLFASIPSDPHRPVGTLALQSDVETSTTILHWLAVLPPARRQGVAGALIEAAEARTIAEGGIWLRAEAPITSVDALCLYEALHFDRIR